MALSRREIDARNQQIAEAQNAIRRGDAAAAQNVVNNLIGGANIGGAQAALQNAINNMPPSFAPPPPSFAPPPSFSPPPSFGGGPPSFPPSFVAAPPYFPRTPAPAPDPWMRQKTYQPPKGVKQSEPDTVLFDESAISPELLLQLQYEDVAGIELATISRSDIVDGQDVIYSPIKNLAEVRKRYNPNNIIPISENSDSFFSKFAIDLNLRNPTVPYFDNDGNLVIEIENVRENEVIEAQVDTNGIIDKVDLL